MGTVVVVERIGRVARSLTIVRRGSPEIFACDATGVPLDGSVWCGVSAGLLRGGGVTDPRLGLLCRNRDGGHVASAFVNPLRRARWIAVEEGRSTELYPTAAGLPVRIATAHDIQYGRARATFRVTQLDARRHVLARGRLFARVAG